MDDHESYRMTPERFREDYDPDPDIEPERAGPDYSHVDPRDVLDPYELAEYRRQRAERARRRRRAR